MKINRNLITQKINPVLTKGNGDITLVFLHYFGGDGGSWLWTMDHLHKDFKCISLTLPGFGNTEPLKEKSVENFARWIADQLQKLHIKNYVLCGHSMSCKLLLLAATIVSQKPEHLILVAPSPPTVERMETSEKERMLHHPAIDEAKTTVTKVTKTDLKFSLWEYAVISQLRIESKTWAWWLQEGMEHNVAEIIKDLKIPTTVLAGENDPVIDLVTIQNEVLPYLYKPELVIIPEVGHLLPMESPESIAIQIKRISSKTNHIFRSH